MKLNFYNYDLAIIPYYMIIDSYGFETRVMGLIENIAYL